ncbi:MAG: Adenosine monophosphate-protein transferase SoFic [Verrucomicrobia bacterium ADurb.Bin345]|nr:MAG: Adenosine monophosphate-protein transferase SoFic [Verrucomicrobia bacterium ADurb.Bin345]
MMKRRVSGRLVRCSGGYRAFIPEPLPPKLHFTPSLLRSLSDADRFIGQLAAEGHRLPNPHLLMRPFLKREAVLSSRIEGTQATLGELLAADAGATVARSPDDLKEVGNYVAALEHGIKRLGSLPLSLRLVTEVHKNLMHGVRGEHATPGEFRRSQNWIGTAGCTLQNASYIPPPPDHLMGCLGKWENFLHARELPPLIQAALMHYQFEAIHPFLDGNGRVGRAMITLFLVERDILPTPLLYLSAFFDATRQEYYDRLQAVSKHAAWESWAEYFLNGIARMSEDALSRARRINALVEQWRRMLTEARSKTAMALVDLLAENPYWTTNKASERLGVAFTTAQRAIDKLQKLDILHQAGNAKRDRVYCASPIMTILDEPPMLLPKGRTAD